MKRRDFIRNSTAATLSAGMVGSWNPAPPISYSVPARPDRAAKNIIFLVSDGMSLGTLQMADLLSRQMRGKSTCWMELYQQDRIRRALMDTASLNAYVTDSAAAASAWGGGMRVRNGRLNIGPEDVEYKPILQKFKEFGKAVGCVTSVPITHATPAGFCINNKSRGDQTGIALQYLDLGFDVMLGGGKEFFLADRRADGLDLFQSFRERGFHAVQTKPELMQLPGDKKPIMGVFHESGLPYAIDHQRDAELLRTVPSLADMTQFAINRLQYHDEGFVIQVEGGKVDWAAHANDTPALLHDQLAFDAAVQVAIDFAELDEQTLVIITTDHGNANPGLIGTSNSIAKFNRCQQFQHSHEWIFQGIRPDSTSAEISDRIAAGLNLQVSSTDADRIKTFFQQLNEEAFRDVYKLPYRQLAEILEAYTGVGWAGSDHSADFVELAMFGPGSEMLKPFVLNTELHNFMLQAAAVEVAGQS